MKIRLILQLFAVASLASCVQLNMQFLTDDSLDGRNNGSAGSIATQDVLVHHLKLGSQGPNSAGVGDAAYKQAFAGGTNILGVIPGSDLAHEYVMIGAHYDHLASCPQILAGDTVCNGATDNATGVAAVLEIALAFAVPANAPRRSVILAFWDREEDGLLGSAYYINNPLVPLASTVAYINFDIQGSNLLPSLRDVSIAVAAETGGPGFVSVVQAAIDTQPLNTQQFSAIFGQGRSDYANLIAAGVPSVFFTDSTGPCYHTTGDDLSVVDFGKLDQQISIARELALQLTSGAVTPIFTAAPAAVYSDAVVLDSLIQLALADIGRFSPTDQSTILDIAATMTAVVGGGEGAFAGNLVTTLISAQSLVSLLSTGECDGFLLLPPG